ncbi:uncharacterized protein LOC116607137 isoform X2 [Nematostella vectensis]|uniref:uncharacterized protein LOC116607137 isoform X2 n=1 Tax=Nematostella vectensis TaxID=45351 RepID=UPI00207764F8|nr:uncharacterized protein LOC116607137 isoform X2 [Nematostella vectensis]
MEFQCYIKTSGSLFFLLVNSYNNKGTDTKVMHYGHGIIIRFTGGKPQKSLTGINLQHKTENEKRNERRRIYTSSNKKVENQMKETAFLRRLAWWTRKKY